jgi:hypothetical protein
MACDARTLFTEWFFCNLYNDFLAGLQHFGNQLRAPVLLMARMPVPRRLMRPPSRAAAIPTATALRTIAATHGPLKSRTRLLGNSGARGRLRTRGLLTFRAGPQFFAPFGVIV